MSHPRIPILLNPMAGSLHRSGLNDWLQAKQDYFDFIETTSVDDLRAQARRQADLGAAVVAVAGGDGTLMEAAHGLMGSETAMGVLPCGTMNVFAREIGVGSRRFDRALKAMLGTHRQSVDIFRVNEKPFIQLAGFGLDARVVKSVTPWMKKYLGAASHLLAAVKVSMEPLPQISVQLPTGEAFRGSQVILGNGRRYGGEAMLFAHASLNDGMLDMAVIEQDSANVAMEIAQVMLLGGAHPKNVSDSTKLAQIDECHISCEGKLAYQLDGDYAGTIYPGETAHIRRSSQKLKVCVLSEKNRGFALPQQLPWLDYIHGFIKHSQRRS